METQEREAIANWFADTWLMVAENDRETYEELIKLEEDSVSAISDKLRDDWDTLTEQVANLVDEEISETAGLFIKEILIGWGTYPFDLIYLVHYHQSHKPFHRTQHTHQLG